MITLKIDQTLVWQPGQFLAASANEDPINQLPQSLFIEQIMDGEILICTPAPQNWQPGQTIHFRGPLGQGFQLSMTNRRYLLIGFDSHPGRLMPLINSGIDSSADVVLAGDFVSSAAVTRALPAEVEMASTGQLDDLMQWADFIAIDVPLDNIRFLGNLFHIAGKDLTRMDAQVLVYSNMPCAGIAECGICAVRTKSGYKLGCVDGPVFSLKDLIFD
jgi:hypothetical protein